MSLRSELNTPERADDWCDTSDERAADSAAARSPLAQQIARLECDADAGRITWAECADRLANATRAAAARTRFLAIAA